MTMTLSSKRAVVTGGSRGIGYAVARALVRAGAGVMICARNGKDVEAAVDSLRGSGTGSVLGQTCDVREPEQVRALIRSSVARLGRIDILINNAAALRAFKSVEEMTVEEWRTTIGTNLDGVFYGCHFAVPEMKKAGGGFIINISSLAGKNAFAGGSAYNASKFGLTGLSEALMEEVRHDDIRVAYIMPGSVNTKSRSSQDGSGDSWKLAPEDVAEVVIGILTQHPRCLVSRVEMRPSKPRKK